MNDTHDSHDSSDTLTHKSRDALTQDIPAALSQVREEIRALEQRYGRPDGAVTLLAVSKTKPVSAVQSALECGQRDFGENHLQDAMTKVVALHDKGLIWHFIGALQSNKSRSVAEHFDWLHSLDRTKLARRLHDQRPQNLEPLNVCLQVNIDAEPTKAGLAPAEVAPVAEQICDLPGLRLRGLMAIPKPRIGLESQRGPHRALRQLFEQLVAMGHPLDTLSIGMSDDLEAAIAEGSTMVRVGTAIFGARGT